MTSLFFFFAILTTPTHAKETALLFKQDGRSQTFVAAYLKRKFKTVRRKIANPRVKKEVEYEGVRIKDFLKANGVDVAKPYKFLVKCSDGYGPLMTSTDVEKFDLLLVFREVNPNKDWTKVDNHGTLVSPEPFYIIGNSAERYDEYPWPFQVIEISKSP